MVHLLKVNSRINRKRMNMKLWFRLLNALVLRRNHFHHSTNGSFLVLPQWYIIGQSIFQLALYQFWSQSFDFSTRHIVKENDILFYFKGSYILKWFFLIYYFISWDQTFLLAPFMENSEGKNKPQCDWYHISNPSHQASIQLLSNTTQHKRT